MRPPAGRTVVRTDGPVRALVVGPRRELLKLSATPMRLTRVLPDTTAADQVRVELGPGDLELPRGVDVHVQDVQPRAVAVELDSTFQRVVPVRAVVRLPPETGHVLQRASRWSRAPCACSARATRSRRIDSAAHRAARGGAGRRPGRGDARAGHLGLRAGCGCMPAAGDGAGGRRGRWASGP